MIPKEMEARGRQLVAGAAKWFERNGEPRRLSHVGVAAAALKHRRSGPGIYWLVRRPCVVVSAKRKWMPMKIRASTARLSLPSDVSVDAYADLRQAPRFCSALLVGLMVKP